MDSRSRRRVTGDVDCCCLKSGDIVAFQGLPMAFQQMNSVKANAKAKFIEGGVNHDHRDHFDCFEFSGKTFVYLKDIPEHTGLTVVQLVGQPSKKRVKVVEPTVATAPVVTAEPEFELVGARASQGNRDVHGGILATVANRAGARAGMVMSILLVIARLAMD